MHTVGAGYWQTAAPDDAVARLQGLLDEWAQYSRSGGVRQTEIYRLAAQMGQDPDVLHEAIQDALNTDTREAAVRGNVLKQALLNAFSDVEEARDRLAALRQMRLNDNASVSDADVEAAVAALQAAESIERMVGLAKRRDVEAHARALAMEKFAVAAGAGAELVDVLSNRLAELQELARVISAMKRKETLTPKELDALRHLAALLGDAGKALAGPDDEIRRVLKAIQKALGTQGVKDKPITPQDGKVITGKSEDLARQIESENKKRGGGRRRAVQQQAHQQATPEEADLARRLVDVDREIRGRPPRERLLELLRERAQVASDLEDEIVNGIQDAAEEEGAPLDQDEVEEQIRKRAARALRAQLARTMRDPRPDPNQIARTAVRVKDEVLDALRRDNLLPRIRLSLQELSQELIQINREQARLRDVGDPDGAAALEPERQSILGRMHDRLRDETLAHLQETNPAATMLDVDRVLGSGALGTIRRGIEEQMRFPQRAIQQLQDRLERELRRAFTEAGIREIRERLAAIHERGRRTYRAADVRDELADVEQAISMLSVAAQQRLRTLQEGLVRANLLREQKADDDRYKRLRDAAALIDHARPETLGAFLKVLRQPGMLDYVQEGTVVNMLTSPQTWGITGINFDSNLVQIGMRAVEAMANGPAEARAFFAGARVAFRGDTSRDLLANVLFGHLPMTPAEEARASATPGVLARAREVMSRGYLKADADRAMVTGDWEQHRPELMGSLPWVGRVYRNLIYRIATRPLSAADAAQGYMLYSAAVSQLADRRAGQILAANKDGYRVPTPFGEDETVYQANPDGTGQYVSQQRMATITDRTELRTWILDHLYLPEFRSIRDEAGKIEDYSMLRESLHPRKGEKVGLLGERALDAFMGRLSSFRYAPRDASFGRKVGAIALHLQMPFFLTSYHASKQALSLSPVGIPANVYRAATAADPYERKRYILKAAVGSLLMLLATYLKEMDWLTGDGPDDPAEYRKWRRTHEPHSIWVPNPVTGQGSWRRIDGLIVTLPLVATANAIEDAQEAARKAGRRPDALDPEIWAAFAGGLAKGTTSALLGQSSLRGLSDVAEVWRGRKTFDAWAASMLSRGIPLSGMARFAASAMDGIERDPQSMVDFLQMTNPFPYGRQGIQAKLNDWGEPIANQRAGLNAFDPLRSTRSWGLDDPIIQRLNAAGISLPSAPDSINNVPLTEAEQRQFTLLAGPILKQQLAATVIDTGWDQAPQDYQQKAIERAVGPIRRQVAQQVLDSIPYDERVRRRELRTRTPVPSPERRAS